jgi:hypothetical protein
MATKVNANQLQKLSTTHKNVSASVMAKTTKAQASTTKLKLDTSRNPAVKAVPARAQAVAQRVTVKSVTIDTRSTELAKRADYVREQAAKASTVKAPTRTVAMPATTTSASRARSSAAKLTSAAKAQPKAPIVKPQPRRPTFLRPLPRPKPDEKPVIKEQFKRNDIVEKIKRVEVLKGAGGKVRVYRSRATNAKVGGRILPTSVTTTTVKTNKTGPHDNPVKRIETRSSTATLWASEPKFVGEHGTTPILGVPVDWAGGAYKGAAVTLKREGGKTELNASGNIGLTARATVTKGFEIGRGPLALKAAAKGSVMIGANGNAEVAATFSSRQASLKAKGSLFAGVGAEGEGSLEILPGIKMIAGGGVNAGIGVTAQGEATVSPNRLRFSGGIGGTFGLGGKVKYGIDVDVPKLAAATSAGVQYVRATPVGRAVESRARPLVRAVETAARPAIRTVAATYNQGVRQVQAVVATVRKTPVGQAVTRAYNSGAAAVQNGFVAVQKSPVGKAVASTYKSVTKAWNGFWGQ